jgi:hypothetical protein
MKSGSSKGKIKLKSPTKIATTKKKKTKSSFLKQFVEFVAFAIWLLFTGFAGYFVGRNPNMKDCSKQSSSLSSENVNNAAISSNKPDCIYDNSGSGISLGLCLLNCFISHK